VALPRNRDVWGPERASLDDIEPLNRVFSDAFTERYRRDGMTGVRVPFLHPAIWRYALEDSADGAMVWRDGDGGIVGFNIAHRSGTEGWMGPLAVSSDWQGRGIGRGMLEAGIAWLRGRGARTIGLETMPRTVDNIGFYSRLGFEPGWMTITMMRELAGSARTAAPPDLMARGAEASAAQLAECRALLERLAPGSDYSREIALTRELALGDVVLVRQAGALAGFGLWHSAPLAAGRPADEVRVLKLVATDSRAFAALVGALESAALRIKLPRLSFRCQTRSLSAWHFLVDRGYRVHWTDLRMSLQDYPEATVSEGAVVWSNWEV
jgi:GNAT superfamily N-acetyltransferase